MLGCSFVFSWLLLGTAVTFAENANININYNYTVFRSQDISEQDAYMAIDAAGLTYLENEIQEADVDVMVQNFTSSTLSACSINVMNAPENGGLGECVEASGSVWISIDSSIRQDLVQRLSVTELRQFIEEFNDDNQNLHIGYVSPIPIKFAMVLSLNGVTSELGADEANRLRNEIMSTLGPVLEQGNPPFIVRDVKVVAQQLQERRRRRASGTKVINELGESMGHDKRRLQDNDVPGNNVEIIFIGDCAVVDGNDLCTPQDVQAVTDTAANDNADTILQNLQTQTPTSDYFDQVEQLSVNEQDSLLTINVTQILDLTNDIPPLQELNENESETEDEEIPYWLWGLVGASVLVLLIGVVVARRAIQERNKEELLRQAFEENQRQSSMKELMPEEQSHASRGSVFRRSSPLPPPEGPSDTIPEDDDGRPPPVAPVENVMTTSGSVVSEGISGPSSSAPLVSASPVPDDADVPSSDGLMQ